MKKRNGLLGNHFSGGAFLLLFLLLIPVRGFSQPPAVNWVDGPNVVDLGDKVAEIELGSAYTFANAADTRRLMQFVGNLVSNREVGLITQKDSSGEWYMLFAYESVGFIKDDEKEDINADKILASIRKSTEAANKIRMRQGHTPVKVLGWHIEPYYDEETNNLIWAILGEESGQKIVNYNTRLLGRHGYMSAILVTDLESFKTLDTKVDEILSGFSYKEGKTYAEFVQGDKIAKYGLTALVAGGAATVAAKTGLLKILLKFLAKGGKLAIVGVMVAVSAIIGVIKAFFSLFTGKSRSEDRINPTIAEPEPDPKPMFIDKVEKLVAEGRGRDAIVLIRSEKRGEIKDLKLAKIYYTLLKDTHQIPELLKHSKSYIDLLVSKKRNADAYGVYEECLSCDAKFAPNPLSLYNLAQWLAKEGETKKSMRACIHFTKVYPNHAFNPDAYFLLAKMFNEKLNDKNKAQKTIRFMIKKFPKHKQTPTARNYLAEMGQPS